MWSLPVRPAIGTCGVQLATQPESMTDEGDDEDKSVL